MAYYKIDTKKFARLRKEARMFQDDIVCAVGTDFMRNIAEAENRMIFDILSGLESEATADVEKVKHGFWKREDNDVCYWYVCSECRDEIPRNKYGSWSFQNYCPNCGAKMDIAENATTTESR